MQLFSSNLFSKLVTVVAIASALVVMTAVAYSKVTNKALDESMFRTYTVLQNTPGALPQSHTRDPAHSHECHHNQSVSRPVLQHTQGGPGAHSRLQRARSCINTKR
jgi:hypothetical protein